MDDGEAEAQRDRALQRQRAAELKAAADSAQSERRKVREKARALRRGVAPPNVALDVPTSAAASAATTKSLSPALLALLADAGRVPALGAGADSGNSLRSSAQSSASSSSHVSAPPAPQHTAHATAHSADPNPALISTTSGAASAGVSSGVAPGGESGESSGGAAEDERARDQKEREAREARRKRERIGIEKDNIELLFDITVPPPAPAPSPAPAPALHPPPAAPALARSPEVRGRSGPAPPPIRSTARSSAAALARIHFHAAAATTSSTAALPRAAASRSPARSRSPAPSDDAASLSGSGASVVAGAAAYRPAISAGTLPAGYSALAPSSSSDSAASVFAPSSASATSGYHFTYHRPTPSVIELVSTAPLAFPALPAAVSASASGAAAARIAAFDLDDTIIRTASGKRFAQSEHDWKSVPAPYFVLLHAHSLTVRCAVLCCSVVCCTVLFDVLWRALCMVRLFNAHVVPRLQHAHSAGYLLVIFSNQMGIANGKTSEPDLLRKLHTLGSVIQCPLRVLMSMGDDAYRKPQIGMWELVTRGWAVDKQASFFVGAQLFLSFDAWPTLSFVVLPTCIAGDAAGRTAEELAAGVGGGGGGGGSTSAAASDDESEAAPLPATVASASAASRSRSPYGRRRGRTGAWFAGAGGGGAGGDFSGSDRRFAINAGISFYTPEQFFLPLTDALPEPLYRAPPPTPSAASVSKAGDDSKAASAAPSGSSASAASASASVPVAASLVGAASGMALDLAPTPLAPSGGSEPPDYTQPTQEVVFFVGPPASGKTTFFNTHFAPTNRYVHVNRDTAGQHTVEQAVRRMRAALAGGQSVVIDNTNPSQNARAPYWSVVQELNAAASASAAAAGSPKAGAGGCGGHRITVRAIFFSTPESIARRLNIYRNRLNSSIALIPPVRTLPLLPARPPICSLIGLSI
jgi:HAD superfamily hydrolase (TIGR01662 family)